MALLTATEVLEWAIEIEKNGEAFYSSVAAETTDSAVKALFEDLAVQEQGHRQTFETMLAGTSERDLSGYDYDEYQAYLQAALDRALFSGPGKGLTLAKQVQDRTMAVQAAMGFEKDTLLFFYDLRDTTSKAHRETISAIIREEKKHLRRLAGML